MNVYTLLVLAFGSLFASLQISCGSCQACAEPEPIFGIPVIFQTAALTDTLVSVWVKTDQEIAGVQFQAACKRKRADSQRCALNSLLL